MAVSRPVISDRAEYFRLTLRSDICEKPNLATVARVANRASGLLRIQDLDEKIEVENAATIQIAKRHGLMS
jgi:hypothetical protein